MFWHDYTHFKGTLEVEQWGAAVKQCKLLDEQTYLEPTSICGMQGTLWWNCKRLKQQSEDTFTSFGLMWKGFGIQALTLFHWQGPEHPEADIASATAGRSASADSCGRSMVPHIVRRYDLLERGGPPQQIQKHWGSCLCCPAGREMAMTYGRAKSNSVSYTVWEKHWWRESA